MCNINYHNITYPDQNNGDGLRVVLWLSGCHHHCENCQNPQTWNPDSGIKFDESAKQEIFEQLEKDYISGITFSGGDPLAKENIEEVYNLIDTIRQKFPDKTIWLYSGYTWSDIFDSSSDNQILAKYLEEKIIRKLIVKNCDVFVDGRFIEKLKDVTLHWVGSNNQRIIDVKKSLEIGDVILYEETV